VNEKEISNDAVFSGHECRTLFFAFIIRGAFIIPLSKKKRLPFSKRVKKRLFFCFFFLSLSLSLLCSTRLSRYAIALERKQKEREKRKNEKTLDLKRDGCIPYGFKVYVDERSHLFEYNFQTHLHSFQRACGDIYYTRTHTHTHQREGERINDARVIDR